MSKETGADDPRCIDSALEQVIEMKRTAPDLDMFRMHAELIRAEKRGVERAVRWFLRHLNHLNEYEEIIRRSVEHLT